MEAQRVNNQKRVIFVVGSIFAVVALVLGIILATQDDDDPEATTTSSTSTTAEATTTSSAAATTTTTTIDRDDLDMAIFPDLRSGTRFDAPDTLAKAFATEVLGFDTDATVSDFGPGDNRSGEIQVYPAVGERETTVLVRQISDDSWVVIGAGSPTIQLETPISRSRISSPQPLIGAASAFEGNVLVQLYADGSNAPIGATNVLGRGDGELGDFTGSLTFEVPEGATHGTLVLSEASAEDGTTVAATALRVRF